MTASLISFTKNVALFAVSISAGIVGYVLFAVSPQLGPSQTGESIAANTTSLGNGLIALFSRKGSPGTVDDSFSFDDAPVFVAELKDPVDMGRDAFGVAYFLQRDGQVMRLGLNGNGAREIKCFARLANNSSDEGAGFSAIAFHPQYLIKNTRGYGKFYVIASEKAGSGDPDFSPIFVGGTKEDHQDVLYEFRTANPFSPAFLGKRREILRLSQPGPENNFSSLAFDKRGFLYLGVGDGAERNSKHPDISRNASSLLSAFGKVLRIDPVGKNSVNGQYGIPSSNPFRLVPDALPELWAYGLRSPHNLSIDPFNEWLFISERGRDGTSELNISRRGAEHFGWDLIGGASGIFSSFMTEAEDALTGPQIEFTTEETKGDSVNSVPGTGSFIYSGERFPGLVGKAIFGDKKGRIMAASINQDETGTGPSGSIELLAGQDFLKNREVNALRPGPGGEIFVLCKDGYVFEIGKGTTASIPRRFHRPLICSLSLF